MHIMLKELFKSKPLMIKKKYGELLYGNLNLAKAQLTSITAIRGS